MFGTGNGNGTAAAGSIRFSKFIVQHFNCTDLPILITNKPRRILQVAEFDALFFRVRDFFGTCRHFITGTAVNTVHFFSTEPVSHTGGIHCNITAADDRNGLCRIERRVGLIFFIGFHQIGTGEIFIRTEHADQIFAFDVHKLRQACTRADKGGIIAFIL